MTKYWKSLYNVLKELSKLKRTANQSRLRPGGIGGIYTYKKLHYYN